jgi:carboxymethylenebutenolidase
MKNNALVFVLVSIIFISVVFSGLGNTSKYKLLPYAYAQTNAAALATLAANATGAATEVLQIKKGVNYFDNASGYLVYPLNANMSGAKKLAAIIMIHENRGLNDNIKNMANTYSKQGYVILAVDLFKGRIATTNEQARQLASSVRNNSAEAISNLQAAVKYVASLPFVDSSKIASIGWCFGGGQSLQLALHSEQHPLAATILYYGTPLITDKQELSKIKWPVLGIFGDKDQAIPVDKVKQFKAALDVDGITNEIHTYKGVGHAFANPSGANYAPKETADAWQKTLGFLKKYV